MQRHEMADADLVAKCSAVSPICLPSYAAATAQDAGLTAAGAEAGIGLPIVTAVTCPVVQPSGLFRSREIVWIHGTGSTEVHVGHG